MSNTANLKKDYLERIVPALQFFSRTLPLSKSRRVVSGMPLCRESSALVRRWERIS